MFFCKECGAKVVHARNKTGDLIVLDQIAEIYKTTEINPTKFLKAEKMGQEYMILHHCEKK